MNSKTNVILSGRQYRFWIERKKSGLNWSHLKAEYWCSITNEWRNVNNWNTRELIFNQQFPELVQP